MSQEKLFNEFPPVSTEAWEEVIVKDLKGADYNKKLLWRTDDGFTVRPYYRAEDLKDIDYLNTLPDTFPYTRGHKKENNRWEIVQEIGEHDLFKANAIALDSLQRGATMVTLSVKNVKTLEDLKTLLKGIDLNQYGVQFHHADAYLPIVKHFVQYVEENGFKKGNINGGLQVACTPNQHRADTLAEAFEMVTLTDDMPKFKVINVNGIALHNAGATIVQELAYSLAIAEEYLHYFTDKGMDIEKVARKVQMTLSVGSHYFMEIAKLRAIRLLWSTMVSAYNPSCSCAYKLTINTVASTWNKTMYDPYVNMLRSTTEGMSAALGGADSIALKPFDIAYKKDDEFSRRMARNAQIILKEEAFFDKVVDPAAGSYYVENLTNSIAETCWKQFQGIEAAGGMFAAMDAGRVTEEIEKSRQKRDMDIATRRYILLGTNQYPNLNETMTDKIEDREDALCCPNLPVYRGAAAFEEIRLATERYAKSSHRPKVFLLKIGNLAMRQARAGFVTNFYGCAGYEIIENSGFATVEEGLKAAAEAKADFIAVCSSDEEYATLGLEAVQKAKAENPKRMVVIAGNPECAETLKAAGADDFIHVKVNVLETLRRYNQLLLS